MPSGSRWLPSPVSGTNENSPPIYRWETPRQTPKRIPPGTTELLGRPRALLPSLTGLAGYAAARHPTALQGWAIIDCPCGTQTRNASFEPDQPTRFRSAGCQTCCIAGCQPAHASKSPVVSKNSSARRPGSRRHGRLSSRPGSLRYVKAAAPGIGRRPRRRNRSLSVVAARADWQSAASKSRRDERK